MIYLIYFSGMPGSGKTTTSRKLKYFIKHSLVISRNSIKEWINDFNNNYFEENLIYNIMIKSSDVCLSNNYSAIIDGAGWKKSYYEKFRKIALKHQAKFISVRLVCKIETSRRRTMKRKREYRWDKDRLKNFKNIFERIPIDITISSDRYDVKEIVGMICKKIESII